MRIAPKPTKGHEIALDDLLGKQPSGRTPDSQHTFINFETESMTLTGVKMKGDIYTIEVYYQPMEAQESPSKFLQEAKRDWTLGIPRPASTLEAYAIFATLVENIDPSNDPLTIKDANEGLDLIRKLWQASPFFMYTQFDIKVRGFQGSITHLEGPTDYGTFGYRDGLVTDQISCPASACKMLFGEENAYKINAVFKTVFGNDLSILHPKSSPYAKGVIVQSREWISAGAKQDLLKTPLCAMVIDLKLEG